MVISNNYDERKRISIDGHFDTVTSAAELARIVVVVTGFVKLFETVLVKLYPVKKGNDVSLESTSVIIEKDTVSRVDECGIEAVEKTLVVPVALVLVSITISRIFVAKVVVEVATLLMEGVAVRMEVVVP
jgi:hypothetical protein